MSHRLGSHLLVALKFLVSMMIIAWLVWRVEPEQWATLRERPKSYGLFALAMGAFLVSISISFFRWWMLVCCQGISFRLIDAFRLGSIGFLLSFVSAGSVGGDLFKMIFLARRSPGKGVEAVASVVVDRGLGLLGLVWLVALAMSGAGQTSNPELIRIGNVAVTLAIVGTLVLVALVFGGRSIDRLLTQATRLKYVGRIVARMAGPLRVFHRHPQVFVAAFGLSLGVHVMLVLSAYWIARGLFGELAPGLGDHMVIFPIAGLASALPIAPAGLGVLEVVMEWLYRVVPSEPSLASGTVVALVIEFMKILMAMLGMFFYWVADGEIDSSLKQAKVVSESEWPSRDAGVSDRRKETREDHGHQQP